MFSVIIGTLVKEAKANNEIREAPSKAVFEEKPSREENSASPPETQSDTGAAEKETISIAKDEIERMLEYAKIL